MSKIVRTGMVGVDMLDVQLDNGHILLLDCGKLLKLPNFASLSENDLIRRPRTDGERLFWDSGQSMTVNELMDFIREA